MSASILPHRPFALRTSAALALFLLLLLTACGGTAAGQESATPQLTVSMRQFRFHPDEIRIPAGVPVSLNLDNLELLPHSLDIDALDLHIPLEGQEQKSIILPPAAQGVYEVYCGVPGHREAGMVSTLIVE